jgi:8-oxo-dGTP pyrophosphatase MutT (NUDIX family)
LVGGDGSIADIANGNVKAKKLKAKKLNIKKLKSKKLKSKKLKSKKLKSKKLKDEKLKVEKPKDQKLKVRSTLKAKIGRRQVAALPFRYNAAGSPEVLIVTSRETGRFIIPKGWPMKGHSDPEAAAKEAREEAGLKGKIRRKPIGSYKYWKRLSDHFRLIRVDVYLFEVSRQLETWREKQSRQMAWLSPHSAALLVDEPKLVTLIKNLEKSLE